MVNKDRPAIAIIGAGQLGSRHLQGLVRSSRPMDVWVVDPSDNALAVARQRLADAQPGTEMHAVTFASSVQILPQRLDVAIIATSSKVRLAVTEALLAQAKVGTIIFEKVLFPVVADYQRAADLLAAHEVSAWVNCPRRMWQSYSSLPQKMAGGKLLSLEVSGSSWGLGCNSVHWLDFMAWLTGDDGYVIEHSQIDPEILPSKRPGFIEFTGSLLGRSTAGAAFRLSSWAAPDVPFVVNISSSNLVATIAEDQGIAWVACAEDGWAWKQEEIHQEFQSALTHLVVESILDTGTCPLTSFTASVDLHLPLLRALLAHLEAVRGQTEIIECPIT